MSNETNFIRELRQLINKYSVDNDMNTPDYIIAKYVQGCMNTLNQFMIDNEKHKAPPKL